MKSTVLHLLHLLHGKNMIAEMKKNEESFFADILASIDYGRAVPELLRERQGESLTELLNPMIEAGVWFEVSADKFLIFDEWQVLKLAELQFLKLNYSDVLCTLQQSLLTKHLFSHSKHLLSDFAFELYEREGILTGGGAVSIEAHFEAVRQVTKKWFTDLLSMERCAFGRPDVF